MACGDRPLAGPGGWRYGETVVGFLLGPLALAFPDLCFCSLLLECPLWKGTNAMRRMHIVGKTHPVPRVHQLARTWHKRAASYVLFLYSARMGPFLPTGLPPVGLSDRCQERLLCGRSSEGRGDSCVGAALAFLSMATLRAQEPSPSAGVQPFWLPCQV